MDLAVGCSKLQIEIGLIQNFAVKHPPVLQLYIGPPHGPRAANRLQRMQERYQRFHFRIRDIVRRHGFDTGAHQRCDLGIAVRSDEGQNAGSALTAVAVASVTDRAARLEGFRARRRRVRLRGRCQRNEK